MCTFSETGTETESKEGKGTTMARKTTEKDIIRYLELIGQIGTLTDEKDELREQLIDDCIKYGIPDEEKENTFSIEIGKSKATLTIVIKNRFNTKRFAKEHKQLYNAYREESPENRVTATTDRK